MNCRYLFSSVALFFSACHQAPVCQQEYLTNAEKGKYWDCIYSTDIFGRINSSYAAPHANRSSQRVTFTYSCDYFAVNHKVLHYTNLDSVTIIDAGADTDIKFNPDSFELHDSVLIFGGKRHKILALTPQVMVLEYEHDGRKASSVYLPSKYQEKIIKKAVY